jgi:hypothetical protein
VSIEQRKTIYLANGWLVRQELRYYSAATDAFEVWTGASGTVTFATDAAGASVISGLSGIVLTESSLKPGVYYAVLTPAQVANLAAYVGQTVYQITVAGASSELRAVLPVIVAQPRYVNL